MRHINSKQEFYGLSRQNLLGNRLKQWTLAEFIPLYEVRSPELPDIIGIRHVRQSFTNKGNSGLFKLRDAYVYGISVKDPENVLFDEGAVHDRLTIQGEVMATDAGLYARYSHLQCHQRTLWHIDANGLAGLAKHQLPHNPSLLTPCAECGGARVLVNSGPRSVCSDCNGTGLEHGPVVKHTWGLRASALLQQYMDDPSWELLNQILGCQHGEQSTRGDEVINFTHPIVEFACFDRPIGVFRWNTLFWEVRTRY